MTFPSTSVTYEAFSKLKRSDAAVGVSAAVLVERDGHGRLSVVEGEDSSLGAATVGGTLIRVLVGVIGGPLGMLLGASAGAATGALVDLDRGTEGEAVMTRFAQALAPGTNGIVAEAEESDETAIDAFVSELGGSVVRAPEDQVVGELEAEQAAAAEAAEAARKALRAKKREEREEKLHDRIDKLKERFAG